MHRVLAIFRNDLRLLRRDPMSPIVLMAMPLVLMAFAKPTFALTQQAEGLGGNGSEQAVPGMVVLFSFFLLGYLGLTYFRDFGWGTWQRLRASGLRRHELLAGKLLYPYALCVAQITILLAVGGLIFSLPRPGSWVAIGLLVLVLAAVVSSLALLLVTLFDSITKVNAIGNVVSLAFAGLGGALSPLSALPSWAEPIARLTPSYWAMRGFLDQYQLGATLSDALPHIGAVAVFAVVCLVIGWHRFDIDARKVSYA